MNALVTWDEKRNQRISALITAGVMILLTLMLFFWIALRSPVPPPDEERFETIGAIDFGNFTNGSSDVNNFQDPSPTPSDNPPVKNTQENASNTPESGEPVVTSTQVSDVGANTGNQGGNSSNTNPKPEIDEDLAFEMDESGGSNHGSGQNVGNSGQDDIRILNDDGLAFGNGIGKGGRMPVALPKPEYNVQEEGRIAFKFIIAPDGHVKYVYPPVTDKINLKKAGMEAIYKYKFTPVPASDGDLTTTVTITFKLK